MGNNLLHIYSQPYEHGDARIVGSRSGLAILCDAISKALNTGESVTSDVILPEGGCLFDTDGEGYQVRVTRLTDDLF